MKDGVPMRDRIGIEFSSNAEAISYCKEIAQDFRDNRLWDDQDLEILVVNETGREIHREFVHREPEQAEQGWQFAPARVRSEPSDPKTMNNSTLEFEGLLGKAALAMWPHLPRDVQESLFESAVAGDVTIRNHLASYLHDHHPKTAQPAKPTQLARNG
ncbi:hypothetical protein [Afipia sp. GAS231]|uniref:DUF6894 family protein n=1 Tax=Afipia sp. GAS231 TaxID=1882747 RepID=UPI001FCD5B86|nr:hypothetical protein [Afipia sp. GAS231]